ncbi:MAG: hypothetical protein K6E13_08030, partial [Lachnospiraceae bacterium]|nr:hypothetical protein [Lachnospiraceae bacterium]
MEYGKYSYRKIKYLFAAFAFCIVMFFTTVRVDAAGILSIAVSKSSMNVGDTVVITVYSDDESGQAVNSSMTITYDSSMLEYVSSSASSASGGGGTVTASGSEIEYTFKAVGGGTAAITASADSMTAAGVKLQVSGTSTQTSETTSTDNETTADSTSETDTAESAQTENNTAEADTAESGETAVASGLALVDDINAQVTETTGIQVTVNDTVYEISSSLSETDIPEGFSVVEILYGETSATGVNNATGSVSMFYLVNTQDNSDQGFYVYDADT